MRKMNIIKFKKIKSVISAIWYQSCKFIAELIQSIYRHVRRNKSYRELRNKPCYIMCGPAHSGRRHLLVNSGLCILDPKYFGNDAIKLVEEFSEFNWYFTQEAIFIDIVSKGNDPTQIGEKMLAKFLYKRRKTKPISGVILTFSLPQLMLVSHKERREFVRLFVSQVKNLYAILKLSVPVYTIFTKCDLIQGFNEFFSDMSKEELSQVWGLTFSLFDSSNITAINSDFESEFDQLLAQLQQRVVWTLDAEKNQSARDVIYAFPQQMQLLKKPIGTLINELFVTIPDASMLQLRGIYFTSAIQQGEPYDFYSYVVGRQYGLQSTPKRVQEQYGESYFIQNLFYKVMFRESQILGFSRRRRRHRKWFYKSTWFAIPAFVLYCWLALHDIYKQTIIHGNYIKTQLNQYHHSLLNSNLSDSDFFASIPLLDRLNNIVKVYQHDFIQRIMLYSIYDLYSASESAFDRGLHVYLMPRVAANFEKMLRKDNVSLNSLYAYLKGYLAFSSVQIRESKAIRAPMHIYLNQLQGAEQSSMIKRLRVYVWRASQLQLDTLPIDWQLVNKIRLQLQGISPEKRAIALLSILTIEKGIDPINIKMDMGSDFDLVFSEKNNKNLIPGLYSAAGYKSIFRLKVNDIAAQITKDNIEIGLNDEKRYKPQLEQLNYLIRKYYNANYIKEWRTSINNIGVKSFTNFNELSNALSILSVDSYVLNQLASLIDINTFGVNDQAINGDETYKKLHNFINSKDNSNLLALQNKFRDLNNSILGLINAKDTDQKALQYALHFVKRDNKNSLYRLSVVADQAPQPLKMWIESIVANCWELILQHALTRINVLWQQRIFEYYVQHLEHYYPLDLHAKVQLDLHSFTAFFGPQGILSQFFDHYLAPFVIENGSALNLYKLDGHALSLNRSDINLFLRMQRINDLYFDEKGRFLSIHFSIDPVLLDDKASHATLIIDDQKIDYAHGPSRPTLINWPSKSGLLQTKLIISNFSHQNFIFSNYGPWSFFKLVEHSHIYQSLKHGGYIMLTYVGPYFIKFFISSNSARDAFTMDSLKGFSIPQKI